MYHQAPMDMHQEAAAAMDGEKRKGAGEMTRMRE